MSLWIVLVYHSRDHEYHKIPENIKHNLMSAQLKLSIMICIKILNKIKKMGFDKQGRHKV